jgi:hypothetical protein
MQQEIISSPNHQQLLDNQVLKQRNADLERALSAVLSVTKGTIGNKDVGVLSEAEKLLSSESVNFDLKKLIVHKQQEALNDLSQSFRYDFEGSRDADSLESFIDEFIEKLNEK